MCDQQGHEWKALGRTSNVHTRQTAAFLPRGQCCPDAECFPQTRASFFFTRGPWKMIISVSPSYRTQRDRGRGTVTHLSQRMTQTFFPCPALLSLEGASLRHSLGSEVCSASRQSVLVGGCISRHGPWRDSPDYTTSVLLTGKPCSSLIA